MTLHTAFSDLFRVFSEYLNQEEGEQEQRHMFLLGPNTPAGGGLAGGVALAMAICAGGSVWAGPDAEALFAEHCASCHAPSRLGGTGPALIPETLGRMLGPKLEEVIAHGRPATQMEGFAAKLSGEDITALADYLATPLAEAPVWSVEDANASRMLRDDYHPAAAPVFRGDPMNVTIVVEAGDHHISVIDGDTFTVINRFETPFAVHGGPKFSPEGRFVYVMSRDGWVQKYDLWSLQEVGRVRAGLNSRNIALSADGKWIAVANYLPQTLSLLSADDLSVVEVLDVSSGGQASRVSAVYQAPPRESFVLALKDIPEVWEVFYGANPPATGFAHDFRTEPPVKGESRFPIRRIAVSDIMDDFFFDGSYTQMVGASRDGTRGLVLDLDIGKEVAEVDLPGMPHLGSGITWNWQGHEVLATPHLKEGVISVIDMDNWQTVKRIPMAGPGFFMRSHSATPYALADVFFGPHRDEMAVIDKASLEIVRTLKPEPGKLFAHAEYSRDGRFVYTSLMEDEGAIIIYDAASFAEIKRLPMRKPIGKYNVWNKITFDAGTSH